MPRKWSFALVVAGAACLALMGALEPTAGQEETPPYVIHLRGRTAEVTPERDKDAQTAGGFIDVGHRSPNTLLAVMHGGVVAGSEKYCSGTASMRFHLDQEFEIVATHKGLQPPRISIVGVVIGSLQSTQKGGGTAEQGPGIAVITAGDQPLVRVALRPHSVGSAQRLLVNDRDGPCAAVVSSGVYCLHQDFEIQANQPFPGPLHYHIGSGAAANFDPEPKFDARYSSILKPFRAVPNRDFGFTVLINVAESSREGPELLPLPRPPEKVGPAPTVPSGAPKKKG